jgi:hypothetical protein
MLLSEVVSEILASMSLLVMITSDILFDAINLPGHGSILAEPTGGYSAGDTIHSKRIQALAVYIVIMICQIFGIFVSHQLIHYKNVIATRLHAVRAAASQNENMELPSGCKWHFFLVRTVKAVRAVFLRATPFLQLLLSRTFARRAIAKVLPGTRFIACLWNWKNGGSNAGTKKYATSVR